MKKLCLISFVLVFMFGLTACESPSQNEGHDMLGEESETVQINSEVKNGETQPSKEGESLNENQIIQDKVVENTNSSESNTEASTKSPEDSVGLSNKIKLEPFSTITENDFNDYLKGKDITIIDIRTAGEIAMGKISKNPLEIDFYGENFKENLNKLDKDKTYFIYCAHGNRSREAKKIMKELGFKMVYDLKGGAVSWKGKMFGKPVRAEVIQEFLGKPALIVFAGTYCPHCQAAMPELETKIWDNYKEKMNIFVNVIDQKKFPQERINQGYKATLSYKLVAQEGCDYVPAWILLSKDGNVEAKSCGGEGGVEKIIKEIEAILS